jgi:two-component system chemotaxis response regulator CheY
MANFLIADDSLVMRKTIKNFLEQLGHQVIGEAENGLEVYNKFKDLKPDGILMDIEMPVMNGIEAIKKIKAESKNAKILVISNHGEKNLVMDALKAGAKYYILKPLTQENLKRGVEILFS